MPPASGDLGEAVSRMALTLGFAVWSWRTLGRADVRELCDGKACAATPTPPAPPADDVTPAVDAPIPAEAAA